MLHSTLLSIADRVVIQDFHNFRDRTLVTSTRPEVIKIKQKYAWWYNNQTENYQNFKENLISWLPAVEIMEGKDGFGYE